MKAPQMILFERGSHISWWSALGSVPDKVAFAATNANSNPKWKCQPYVIKAINPKQVQR